MRGLKEGAARFRVDGSFPRSAQRSLKTPRAFMAPMTSGAPRRRPDDDHFTSMRDRNPPLFSTVGGDP